MSPLATFDFFRYHGVWSPGVRLFRRMRFVGKAAVICAVFLLVLAQLSFLFLRASNRDVEKSERELAGLAVAREVMQERKGGAWPVWTPARATAASLPTVPRKAT